MERICKQTIQKQGKQHYFSAISVVYNWLSANITDRPEGGTA